MQTINVEGYGPLNFPDDMDDDTIWNFVRKGIDSGKLTPLAEQNNQSNQGDARIVPSLGFNDGQKQQSPTMQKLAQYLQQAAESPASQFVLGAGDQFNNAFANMGNMFLPKDMEKPQTQHGQGKAYERGRIAGDIASFLPVAGAGGNVLKLAEGLPGLLGQGAARLGGAGIPGVSGVPLGGIEQGAMGGAAGIARRGLGSGAYGATQSPDNRMKGGVEMGLTSAITDSLLHGASKAFPGIQLSKGLPEQELLENLRVSKGTETGLGRVIGSPKIMGQHENFLSKMPFSGVTDTQAEVADQIEKKGMNILEEYRHGISNTDVGDKIKDLLKKAYEGVNKEKNALYNIPESLSNQLKYRVQIPSLSKETKDSLKDLDRRDLIGLPKITRKLLKKIISEEKKEKELRKQYSKELEFLPKEKRKEIIDSIMPKKEDKGISLHNANISKAALRDLGEKFESSPLPNDRFKAGVLYKLSNSLTKDRNEALDLFEESGHPEIRSGMEEADKFYANSFAPYLQKALYGHIKDKKYEGKSPQTIVSDFIKSSRESNRFDKIDQLMNALPRKGKDLVKYSYLSKAIKDGKVKPMTIRARLGKLTDEQMSSLFPKPGEAQKLKDYSRLAEMNQKSFDRMINPETGAKAMHIAPYGAMSAGMGIGGLLGGGPAAMAVGLASPFVAGNMAHKLFSNEKYREYLVKSIIEAQKNKGKQPFGKTSDVMKSGISSAIRHRREKK